jgi:surface antigen
MLGLAAKASGYYGSNCVAYAREVTGMNISGNAGDWWDNAAGSYRRGQRPEAGAVLVFRPSGHMWAGHVAVVARVVDGREILVNQANWPHGDVVEGAAVYDVSANNDWTTVRVAAESGANWGRLNPTYGFIYPDGAPAREEPVVAQAQPQFPQPQPWATQPWPTQPQPAQPQEQAARPQPRVELAVAEAKDDEPAPSARHAAAQPREHETLGHEKAKTEAPATRKELAAKAKHEHQHELLEAKASKAKTAHDEKLEAKAEHDNARQEKLAKAEHDKAEHVKLAKAEHQKAQEEKLAKAEHAKAEHEKLAKAAREKAEATKLAKAEHDPAKRHAETKIATTREHTPARHTHVARNEQPPAEGQNNEQIAEVSRSGE